MAERPPHGAPAACPARIARLRRTVLGAAAALLLGSAAPVAASETAPAGGDGGPAAETAAAATATAGTASLYFFSPDWRPADLGRLTVAMEGVLARGGVPLTFQAFTRYEDFYRQASENQPFFLIAPAWIADANADFGGRGLRVLARPVRAGRSTYRKALMTRPGVDSIDDLARGSIAATLHSVGPGSPTLVLEAFHLDPHTARVVAVPKDVDAMLALSFGQVDGALVTSEQYDQLARSNAAEASRLHLLAFSPEVPLPPLFAAATADPDTARRLRDLITGLVRTPDASDPLALLGFEGFTPVPPPSAADAPPSSRDAGSRPARKAR